MDRASRSPKLRRPALNVGLSVLPRLDSLHHESGRTLSEEETILNLLKNHPISDDPADDLEPWLEIGDDETKKKLSLKRRRCLETELCQAIQQAVDPNLEDAQRNELVARLEWLFAEHAKEPNVWHLGILLITYGVAADVVLTPDRRGIYASLTDRGTGFNYAWILKQPPFVVFPTKSELPYKAFDRLVRAALKTGHEELASWLETKARGNSRLFICDSVRGDFDVDVNWADRARGTVVHLFSFNVSRRKFEQHVADLPCPPEIEDDDGRRLITKDEFLGVKGAGAMRDTWFVNDYDGNAEEEEEEEEEEEDNTDDAEEPMIPGVKWDTWLAHIAANQCGNSSPEEEEEEDDNDNADDDEELTTLGQASSSSSFSSSRQDEYQLPRDTLAHEYVRHYPGTLRIRRSKLEEEEEAFRIFDDNDRPLMVVMKNGIVLDVTQWPTMPIKSGWSRVRQTVIDALWKAIRARFRASASERAQTGQLVYLARILYNLGPKKIRISPGCGLGERYEISAITDKMNKPFDYEVVAVLTNDRVELKTTSRELDYILYTQ